MVLNKEREQNLYTFLNTLYSLPLERESIWKIGNLIICLIPSDQFEYGKEESSVGSTEGCSCEYPLVCNGNPKGYVRIVRMGDPLTPYTKEEKEFFAFLCSFIPDVFMSAFQNDLSRTLVQPCHREVRQFATRNGLTPMEGTITTLLLSGYPNRVIAEKLDISEATVKRHLFNIFNKTGADDRTHLLFLIQGFRE
ncbi:MAG: LuxR C-terminal-related transcriptional regulator [Spirochaetales bacterium]